MVACTPEVLCISEPPLAITRLAAAPSLTSVPETVTHLFGPMVRVDQRWFRKLVIRAMVLSVWVMVGVPSHEEVLTLVFQSR